MLVLAMQLCAPVPVKGRHGPTTHNLVRPNIARNIDPGGFADEASPLTGIHRSKAMSSTKQCHGWSGMLAIGALVLSARAGMVKAGSTATPTEIYRATEVISHVLGSEQAVIGRKTNRHLAFGIGSHRRIGSTWRDRGRARGMAGGHSLLFR